MLDQNRPITLKYNAERSMFLFRDLNEDFPVDLDNGFKILMSHIPKNLALEFAYYIESQGQKQSYNEVGSQLAQYIRDGMN